MIMQSKKNFQLCRPLTPGSPCDPTKVVYGNQPPEDEESNIIPYEYKILDSVIIKNDCTVFILTAKPTVLFICSS